MRSTKHMIDMNMWNVRQHRGRWVGHFLWRDPLYRNGRNIGGVFYDAFVDILPASYPYELAVDALLDFMDRLRTGLIPRDATEPGEIMALAVQAARRQR